MSSYRTASVEILSIQRHFWWSAGAVAKSLSVRFELQQFEKQYLLVSKQHKMW